MNLAPIELTTANGKSLILYFTMDQVKQYKKELFLKDQYKKYKRKEKNRRYYLKHKEKLSQKHKEYHYEHRTLCSIKAGSNPDLSPNQQPGRQNLARVEQRRVIATLASAIPKAHKNNHTSDRKGVSYDTHNNRWIAGMHTTKINIAKYFKTKEEAVQYREYLENTYYTDEQLHIRNKYR